MRWASRARARWCWADLVATVTESLRIVCGPPWGEPPGYWSLSPRSSLRLARLLEGVGSRLLYAYEVEWLLSDMLGVEPYARWERPLLPVEPFLDREGLRLRPRRSAASGPKIYMGSGLSPGMAEHSPPGMMTNVFEDAIQALTDRQGELVLQLDALQVEFPFIHESIRLSGTVTVRIHMRETPPSGKRSRRST